MKLMILSGEIHINVRFCNANIYEYLQKASMDPPSFAPWSYYSRDIPQNHNAAFLVPWCIEW
jgi:hypothetical protein